MAEAYLDQIAELKAEIDAYREPSVARNGASHAVASKASA
jgi:hypothetical protein